MALKAKRVVTAVIPKKGVVVWDTTLRPFCVKLEAYDPEVRKYITIFNGLKESEDGKFVFTTKSGVKYIIQDLTR